MKIEKYRVEVFDENGEQIGNFLFKDKSIADSFFTKKCEEAIRYKDQLFEVILCKVFFDEYEEYLFNEDIKLNHWVNKNDL